jgi:hypothetical protein
MIPFRGLHVLISVGYEVFILTLMQKSFSETFIDHPKGKIFPAFTIPKERPKKSRTPMYIT